MELNKGVRYVYTNDGYDGIVKLTLDWDNNVILARGKPINNKSIVVSWTQRKSNWYPSLLDCVNEFYGFTSIKD